MAEAPPGWMRIENTRVLVSVRLTPKGGRDAIDGVQMLSDGREVLGARVRAVPEDGAANAALCTLLAKVIGISNRQVRLSSGATSRLKVLEIDADPTEIAGKLALKSR